MVRSPIFRVGRRFTRLADMMRDETKLPRTEVTDYMAKFIEEEELLPVMVKRLKRQTRWRR